jgi:hypothetical protein
MSNHNPEYPSSAAVPADTKHGLGQASPKTPQFTPGPWVALRHEGDVNGSGNGYYAIEPQSIRFDATYLSASGWMSDANAHLIAAAPTAYALIAKAVSARIDEQWLKDARTYLEAANGNS